MWWTFVCTAALLMEKLKPQRAVENLQERSYVLDTSKENILISFPVGLSFLMTLYLPAWHPLFSHHFCSAFHTQFSEQQPKRQIPHRHVLILQLLLFEAYLRLLCSRHGFWHIPEFPESKVSFSSEKCLWGFFERWLWWKLGLLSVCIYTYTLVPLST